MKIGIDGKKILAHRSDERDASVRLIEALADSYPDSDFLIYTPRLKKNPVTERLGAFHNIRFCLPPPSGFGGELWRKFGISNNLPADKVDVYHGVSGELPLNIFQSGKPAVVSICDKGMLTEPPRHSYLKSKFKNYILRQSCRNAAAIIAGDASIRDMLALRFPACADKIIVPGEASAPAEMATGIMKVYQKVMNGIS